MPRLARSNQVTGHTEERLEVKTRIRHPNYGKRQWRIGAQRDINGAGVNRLAIDWNYDKVVGRLGRKTGGRKECGGNECLRYGEKPIKI